MQVRAAFKIKTSVLAAAAISGWCWVEMACKGGHQGPWWDTLSLCYWWTGNARGTTTKSKGLGKRSQGSKEPQGQISVSRLKPKRISFLSRQSRSKEEKHPQQLPTQQHRDSNQRRQHHIRMCHQHPPKTFWVQQKPLCPSCLLLRHPAVSPAVPGCPAPGIMKRTALQRRGTKDRPCPGCLPFLPGQAAPPCSSSYKRALDPSNPLDTNYSNLSTLNPELQQAHKELCLPRQFTLLQAIKQTTAED